MKKLFVMSLVFLLTSLILTGCFLFRSRKPPITYEELEAKQRVTFAASYDKVWDACLVALATQKIEEIDKESGLITTREQNVSADKMDEYAWSPDYGSFWFYQSSGALDDARYWINIKVSALSEESTEMQITPNFEIHIRDWAWDTTSAKVWERVRSRGVVEDAITAKIARELGGE
jgi:hypothetical protein